MNVNIDPCFEDRSSSLTLKYRPVHFFESICSLITYLVLNMDAVHCTYRVQIVRTGHFINPREYKNTENDSWIEEPLCILNVSCTYTGLLHINTHTNILPSTFS